VRPPLPGARDKDGPHPAVEWAGTHDFTPLLAVPAALDLLEAIGLDRVRAYQAALTAHAADRCDASRPRGRHPGLLALPLSRRLGLTDREVRAAARAAGFEVAAPEVGGARHLRVSAHLYNHPGDYDALAAWLRA
jgi:isopenicillin-N epimerase